MRLKDPDSHFLTRKEKSKYAEKDIIYPGVINKVSYREPSFYGTRNHKGTATCVVSQGLWQGRLINQQENV